MKIATGVTLRLCGCLLVLSVGVWLIFTSAADIVAAIDADILDGAKLGWGIGKCLLAQSLCVASAMALVFVEPQG